MRYIVVSEGEVVGDGGRENGRKKMRWAAVETKRLLQIGVGGSCREDRLGRVAADL